DLSIASRPCWRISTWRTWSRWITRCAPSRSWWSVWLAAPSAHFALLAGLQLAYPRPSRREAGHQFSNELLPGGLFLTHRSQGLPALHGGLVGTKQLLMTQADLVID